MRGLLFILAALAALTLTLVSCQKEPIKDKPISDGDVWEVVIDHPATKSISEVNLVIGSKPSQELTATLIKNGYPYEGTASFTWHNQSGTYYSGSTTDINKSKLTITAGSKAGSGSYVYVDGYSSDGVKRATSNNIAINVTEPVGVESYYCSVMLNISGNGISGTSPLGITLSDYPEGVYVTIPHEVAAQGYSVTVSSIAGYVCNAKTGYEQINFSTTSGTLPTGVVARSTNSLSSVTSNWLTSIITQFQGTGPIYGLAIVDEENIPSGVSGYTCIGSYPGV